MRGRRAYCAACSGDWPVENSNIVKVAIRSTVSLRGQGTPRDEEERTMYAGAAKLGAGSVRHQAQQGVSLRASTRG